MAEPSPSAWATEQADAAYCAAVERWNGGEVGASLGDHIRAMLALAIDAAELRGMERAATICESPMRTSVGRDYAHFLATAIRAAAKGGKP